MLVGSDARGVTERTLARRVLVGLDAAGARTSDVRVVKTGAGSVLVGSNARDCALVALVGSATAGLDAPEASGVEAAFRTTDVALVRRGAD